MNNSLILIIIGLLLFYLIISDKWYCVEGFLVCLKSGLEGDAENTKSPITKLPSIGDYV